MFNLMPESQIEQARAHRNRLLQEAARDRLYRTVPKTTGKSPGATIVLFTGDVFITVGQWLKAWVQPGHQAGPFANARMHST